MAVINLRTLSRETKDVLEKLKSDGEPVVVARRGEPVAVLLPATPERLADAALASSSELREDLAQADAELAAGETQPLDEVLAELAGETQAGKAIPAVWTTNYDRVIDGVLADSTAPQVPEEYAQQAEELDAKLAQEMVERSLGQGLVQARLVSRKLVSLAGGTQHFSFERYRTLVEGATHGLSIQSGPAIFSDEESAESEEEPAAESPVQADAPEEFA